VNRRCGERGAGDLQEKTAGKSNDTVKTNPRVSRSQPACLSREGLMITETVDCGMLGILLFIK
jgi:hypothetical protein